MISLKCFWKINNFTCSIYIFHASTSSLSCGSPRGPTGPNRPWAGKAADDQVDLDSFPRGFADRPAELRILQLVHLGDDPRRSPGTGVSDLPVEQFLEPTAHVHRRDQELPVVFLAGIAGQVI